MVMMKTVRTVLTIAAQRQWHIHQKDVFNVSIQGDLPDEIYMDLPLRFTWIFLDQGAYKKMVGNILYLTMTRPDISYGVQTLSQFLQQPKKSQ